MKKLLGMFLAVFSLFGLVSCLNEKNDEKGETYVSLDINPSVELIVSSNNKVLEFYATNDDAKAMLYEEDINGMNFEEAIDKITDLSIEYGYLSDENSVIEYTINSTEGEEVEKKLEEKIDLKIKNKSNKLKLDIKLSKDAKFSLVRELEALKEAYPDNEAIQNLNFGQFKLIKSAQSSDATLTIEAALELDTKELMDIIKENRDEFYNIATKKYDKLVKESEIAYNKAHKSFERNIYAVYYTKNMINHPVNYGLLYSLYGSAADVLEAVVDLSNKIDSYSKKVLTEKQLEAVSNIIDDLGIAKEEFFNQIKDEEGNITIDSVNAYLDKLVKNLEITDEINELIDELKSSMNEIDLKIKNKIEEINVKYESEIQAVVKMFEQAYNQISSLGALIPEEVKAVLDTYLAELEEMNNTFKAALTEQITLTKINEWIVKLREKEASLLEKINSDLSEEELAEVEELKTKIDSSIKDLKDKFEKAKNDAKDKMHEHFNGLKQNKNKK